MFAIYSKEQNNVPAWSKNCLKLKEKTGKNTFGKISKNIFIFLEKTVDKTILLCYNKRVAGNLVANGSIAQLGEHLPYKQRVIGSSPIVPTKSGLVVQLVRTLACHARGQGFESPSGRHICLCSSVGRAGD